MQFPWPRIERDGGHCTAMGNKASLTQTVGSLIFPATVFESVYKQLTQSQMYFKHFLFAKSVLIFKISQTQIKFILGIIFHQIKF